MQVFAAGPRRHAHARRELSSRAAPAAAPPASARRARSRSSAAGCWPSTPAPTTSPHSACAAITSRSSTACPPAARRPTASRSTTASPTCSTAAARATSAASSCSRHGLVPLSGSTQPLSSTTAGAVQVSFTPRGDQLVVSEKGANTIEHLPRRPLGPRRRRHRPRLGRGRAVRLRVRQARRAQRDRGGRERAHARTRSIRSRRSPRRSLNGQGAACWAASTQRRPLHVHRQRGDGLHLGLLAELEGRAQPRHARRRHGAAGRRHASARRDRLARSLPVRERRQHGPDQRVQDRQGRLADAARRLRLPAGRLRRARRQLVAGRPRRAQPGRAARAVGVRASQRPKRFVIGSRRSRPNALWCTLMPGGPCRRLYSARSTRRATRCATSSVARPRRAISSGERSSST